MGTKEVIERTLEKKIPPWEHDSLHYQPQITAIYLLESKGWRVGQRVRVTIESIEG
jgi:hypothetical protein